MGETTGIQWTHKTWNPWRGCTKVSEGCRNCYMFTEQKRWGSDPSSVVRTRTWDRPAIWNRQAYDERKDILVFTCSWSDWFHPDADVWRPYAWPIVQQCRYLQFQILTKRPELIAERLPPDWGSGYINAWLGVSIEGPDQLNRVDQLRNIPAVLKFLSIEPLLDGKNFTLNLKGIDWVIVGGESGPNARPCDPRWIASIVRQCRIAEVPVFVKQMGANIVTPNDQVWDTFTDSRTGWPDANIEHDIHGFREDYQGADCRIRLRDKKGGDPNEWPESLQVREMPSIPIPF